MQWHELIRRVCADCTFELPASDTAIAEVETALLVQVPEELRALWQETNGTYCRSGLKIWSTQTIIEQNLELRSFPEHNDLYMSFESLLCFAAKGNGDLFFFPIQSNGQINRLDVFLWDHETDSRTWIAPNLQRFVEMHCLTG